MVTGLEPRLLHLLTNLLSELCFIFPGDALKGIAARDNVIVVMRRYRVNPGTAEYIIIYLRKRLSFGARRKLRRSKGFRATPPLHRTVL